MIGQSIAHFRITAKLGEGGMGEVYLASDTRLDRQVAIKLLPAELGADADRLARFQREARVLASLSHPQIAGIHEIGEADGRHFLVMELEPGNVHVDENDRVKVLDFGLAKALDPGSHRRG